MSIASWLKQVADFCLRERTTIVPVLTLIYQAYNSEIDGPMFCQTLRGLTGTGTACAKDLYRTIQRLQKQPYAYRRWVVAIMPFPSTAHFEYLSFGRRLDRRSKWAQAGNKAHSQAFILFKNLPLRPKPAELREVVESITDENAAHSLLYALCSCDEQYQFQRGLGEEWFIYSEPKEKDQAAKTVHVRKSTKGWTSTAEHNAQRFARWIRTANTAAVYAKTRTAWSKTNGYQKERIREILGEERYQFWISGFESHCAQSELLNGAD